MCSLFLLHPIWPQKFIQWLWVVTLYAWILLLPLWWCGVVNLNLIWDDLCVANYQWDVIVMQVYNLPSVPGMVWLLSWLPFWDDQKQLVETILFFSPLSNFCTITHLPLKCLKMFNAQISLLCTYVNAIKVVDELAIDTTWMQKLKPTPFHILITLRTN